MEWFRWAGQKSPKGQKAKKGQTYQKRPKGPKRPKLHDDLWFWHRIRDRLVRQNLTPVDVELILDDDILPQDGHVFHANLKNKQQGIEFGKNVPISERKFDLELLFF